MAEFRLGRLKFNWRGGWQPSTAYVIDDIISLGGNTYVCTVNHTSTTREDLWYTTDYDIATPRWQVHVSGLNHRGNWVGLTTYSINDVFKYGNGQYRVTYPHYSVGAGVSLNYATEYVVGNNGEGGWLYNQEYQYGDLVYYNGSTYVGIITSGSGTVNRGIRPAIGINTAWNLLSSGISTAGISTFANNATYEYGSLVTYGGDTYVAVASSTKSYGAPVGLGSTSTNDWNLLVRGLRFAGTWSTATEYQNNDIVSYVASSYVSVASSNLGKQPGTSFATNKWSLLADGSSASVLINRGDLITRDVGSPVVLGIGTTGTSLRSTGLDPIWDFYGNSQNSYYVSSAGQDWSQWGQTPETAYKTLAFAVTQVQTPCCINLSAGVYSEQLPITVPAFCEIRGSSQRSVFVEPANSGLSTGTMFLMSDHSLVSDLTVRGMTGWAKTTSDPFRILNADTGQINCPPVGVFFGLNPSSPVINKSPYVKEVSGIGTGCIGAYINGNVHASGNKSMVFHAFTVVADSGIGYWIDNNAKAEVVSAFTYWADYGYLTTNGGIIRALNGNNSYGTWGSVSLGYSQAEIAETGRVDGEMLEYGTGQLVSVGTGVTVGAAVTGESSLARGIVVFDIPSTNRIIYRPVGLGTFSKNEVIFIGPDALVSAGATARLVNNTDFNPGINGYIFPLKGLNRIPRIRGGIQFIGVSTNGIGQTTRRTAGSLYGPVSGSGSTVAPGIGSDSSAYTVSAVTNFIAPTYGLAGYANTFTQSTLGSSGSYPSVAVSAAGTGSNAFLNIQIGVSGFVSNISISTAGTNYTQQEQISIDGSQIGGLAGVAITFNADTLRGTAIIQVSSEKPLSIPTFDGQSIRIRYDYSQVRLTGHDFLEIGIGNRVNSNYPNKPSTSSIPGNQIIEGYPGRVYYVTTDQDGNFNVGKYFAVNQATGSATLNASAFNLSGLTSLRLGSLGGQIGEAINEFSSDTSLSGNSNTAVPTEAAVKTYIDTQITKSRSFAYWVSTS